MAGTVHVIDHPLVQHKLSLMRSRETSTGTFRNLLREISMLLGYEVCRDLPTTLVPIDTPIAPMMAPILDGKKTVLVSIMRAGSGILDGMLEILPSARVGHIGLYRDPKTLVAVEYYYRVPDNMGDRDAIVVDPMLATGNSAVAAVDRLKESSPRSIKFVCLLTCPEGLAAFHAQHPDVPVYTAAIDERLNEKSYIVPGLGDAGDRLFGTK
ncbi:MAG: uracil phosphoribosyltransferase [Deltaproteobacteria bacterium]|nr:MAG: uracil phosphoribosyltransferase [Deltaproteobacteria bacterium]TMQ20659.1 MAG: uracil phosphoribosyltransferase [Deltaproteobacteria bacterium]